MVTDRLEEIIEKTLSAIEDGREEIFHIAETSRSEMEKLTQELNQLRLDLSQTIVEVDRQQKIEKRQRIRLMEVSRDYQRYSEKQMMTSYAEAKDSQVQLKLLQSMEKQQKTRRNDIERLLSQMSSTVERAENLMNKVNMAITLLKSNVAEEIQNQNLEQRQEAALRIIKAREEERRRVAREIHDGPAQTLANIILRLEIAEKLLNIDPQKVEPELVDLKKLVRLNLQDIRRIIFDLRPMALDEEGMVPAIRRYLNSFQQTYNISCQLNVKGEERKLKSALNVTLFRLIQEAITNVAKHAQSDQVIISLDFSAEKITACIKDFGQGFDVKAALESPGEHFGLIGIKERVEMFSGQLKINSQLGKGTTIKFIIPCRLQKEGEPA